MGGEDAAVERQSRAEGLLSGVAVARGQRLLAHLGLQEAEHEGVVGLAHARDPGLDLERPRHWRWSSWSFCWPASACRFFGSTRSASWYASLARSRKPALRKSVPRLASA